MSKRVSKETLRMTKARFSMMGIKLAMCNIETVKTLSRESVGHVKGWTKTTVEVTTKDGKTYVYTSEPTGIYSGICKFTLVK